MGFYDLCVKTEELRETLSLAEKLGWKGVGILVNYSPNYMRELGELKDAAKKLKTGVDVGFGIEINPGSSKNSRDVRKIAKNIRKEVELVVVRGGKPETDRVALETPEVDILTHHSDMRINQVLAKLAVKNNVAVGFLFSDVLLSYKRTRISLFSMMINNAGILKKYRSPFVISSGSLSTWDLRSPSDILAFGKLLGYQENSLKNSLSNSILKENRKRLGKKWVMPGVEIE